ncbi:peptidoglycan-binding protein [Streptomyces sp. NBC_01808]|uniref:peptidoglycan-binding domain-containing protein n=1 Tax=Streptomyces sp. NBC_01808 TaxID=2975947 RepID=UPI002DDA4B2B|nr:peptidoglycan-binding domain-containing protein [Streptomyces sp. NBC_01808]WSA41759.1 peptidoglycan-binding protein [Streptomyces sp. NBC_01808]
MRATEAGGGQDADGGSEPGPGTELLPVPRAAFLPQVAPGDMVTHIEAAEPEPDDAAGGGEHRRRPTGLLLAAGGAAAVIAGLVVTAGLLTGGSESDDAGPGPARISTGPSGGGEADGGPLGDDEGGAPADGAGAHPDDRAGRDRGGDGDAPRDGRRDAGDDHAGDLAPGRANGQIGSIAPTAPPGDGTSHPPQSSSPTDDAPAVPVLPPVLGPGDSGPEVTELQHRLRQVGLGLLQPADGAYDDGVRTSVRTFQSVNGLEEDERGVYGPETRQELESRTDEP